MNENSSIKSVAATLHATRATKRGPRRRCRDGSATEQHASGFDAFAALPRLPVLPYCR
jgi:hypothetical protein